MVRWILHQIALLYRIERQLREQNTPATLRATVRCAQSSMILTRLEEVLRVKLNTHLPRTGIGTAIGYALGQWDQLIWYQDHGEVEIDNQCVLVEILLAAADGNGTTPAGSRPGTY